MVSENAVGSYGELRERFPGVDQLDPDALGRLAFVAVARPPAEEVYTGRTGEEDADWHDAVRTVLGGVKELQSSATPDSRYEIAQAAVHNLRRAQEQSLIDGLEAGDSPLDQELASVREFLLRWGYRIETTMAPSPLFPSGRSAHTPLEQNWRPQMKNPRSGANTRLVDRRGGALNTHLQQYLFREYPRRKTQEDIEATIGRYGQLDREWFDELRAMYGTKAASLFLFNNLIIQLQGVLEGNGLAVVPKIPPFVPGKVELYQAWLDDRDSFVQGCEEMRGVAINLVGEDSGSSRLVAIRSSAVKSEDGTQHSGAGVYKSVAVDPHDQVAFQRAVEEVYASTRSQGALTYQRSIGVVDELMGLLIQRYQEEKGDSGRERAFYGHANSAGADPRLVEVHTNEGSLLYDKAAIEDSLFLDPDNDPAGLLHSQPDHWSIVAGAVDECDSIPHVVVLAEKFFGGPVQVEFVGNTVVQVRPLALVETTERIVFPEGHEPIAECAAAVAGDMILTRLDAASDNSATEGYIVLPSETGFTIRAGYTVLPRSGAVVVLRPSSSGHIQALCRERGLLCFYPTKNERSEQLEGTLGANDGASLRFVSDGYDGKIYLAPQPDVPAQRAAGV